MPCTRAFVLPRWPSADLPETSSTCDLTGQDIADRARTKTALSGTAAISRRPPLHPTTEPADRSSLVDLLEFCAGILENLQGSPGLRIHGTGRRRLLSKQIGFLPRILDEKIQPLEQATVLGGTRFPREGIQLQGHGPV